MNRIVAVVAGVALVGGVVYVVRHKSEVRESLASAKDRAKTGMQGAFSRLRKAEAVS